MPVLSPCVARAVAVGVALALAPTASAGTVNVVAKVPVDVYRDKLVLAQLYVEGSVSFTLPDGEQHLSLWTNGTPHEVTVNVAAATPANVMVGKNGITTGGVDIAVVPVGPVEFRVAGQTEVMFTLDDKRLHLGPGEVMKLDLVDGTHLISVRDASGTVMWAKGSLTVKEPRAVIVQFAEGRMPEVTGNGTRFVPDGN